MRLEILKFYALTARSDRQNSIASLTAIRERLWRLSKIALEILCLDRSVQRPQSAFGATVLTRMAIGACGKDAVAQPRLIALRNFKIPRL
nr:hypothetical protein [uncultured Campylobacter sp.]